VKISKNITTTLLKALLAFKLVTIFVYILFPLLNKSMRSQKSCAPLSAATGAQHAAMHHHGDHVLLTVHFAKDQAGDNLMVNGQDFKLDVTTLSIQNSRWPLFLG
jgi:hypothetical protein